MELKTYLESRNISVQEFSRILKVPHSTLFMYMKGRRMFPLDVAMGIVSFTKNKVTLDELLDMYKKKIEK
jgi:predicted transcriptional regulator